MKRLFLAALLLLPGAASLAADIDFDQWRGKVVYVDFWASWCGPCRESFPWMQAMQEKYGKDGLVVVAINVDKERKLAAKFLAEHPHPFTVEYDPDGKLASNFQVQTMPSSFLIDRQGKARVRHAGFHQQKTAQYEDTIQRLLAE